MINYTEQLMYGLKPVHREEPQAGQSEYYYFDPRYGDDDARHIVDVPDGTSPNPNADAIQQYLYENDEYRYKNLYGDTPPPPTVQTQSNNTQQLRMPTGSEQQITMPSYELQQKMQQPSTWDKVKNAANNFAGGTKAFSVGYATGATLGNFDEGMGAATAAVTLNPNNYTMGRDATRQLQNDLQQQHPIAYGVGEFTGAMMTPMHLTKGENVKQKAFNALTDTLNASAGYAENWNDFGTNLVTNGAANMVGLAFDAIPIFRTLGSNTGKNLLKGGKKFIKQGINSSADKMKNMYYKEDDDKERYY